MKFGKDFKIWKCERKIGNQWEKLEIKGGGNWRFRNEFGMKNDNWKYFGHLEIIWKKIGKIVNWEIFLEILEKFEKFVDLEKKLGNSGNKLDIWEKNGNLEKIVNLQFFKMSKNLEILKKFGKNLEILKILEIWKKQNWKFQKRNLEI